MKLTEKYVKYYKESNSRGEQYKNTLTEGLDKDQIQAKLIEEGFGDFIRKGIDTLKRKQDLVNLWQLNSMEDLRRLGLILKKCLKNIYQHQKKLTLCQTCLPIMEEALLAEAAEILYVRRFPNCLK